MSRWFELRYLYLKLWILERWQACVDRQGQKWGAKRMETCANCRYSHLVDELCPPKMGPHRALPARPIGTCLEWGPQYSLVDMECRFTAPVVIATGNDDWITVFPKVGPDEWCGLWKGAAGWTDVDRQQENK